MEHLFLMFLDHTRHSTVGRTPLDEWSARRKDLYLTTHDTHNRQISVPPVGFEPTISVGMRLQTYALDRAATGTGPYIPIQLEYQGCGNCHSCCNNIWQSYKFQMFQYISIHSYFLLQPTNPSGRTMTLGLTQPLTETSTRNISWG